MIKGNITYRTLFGARRPGAKIGLMGAQKTGTKIGLMGAQTPGTMIGLMGAQTPGTMIGLMGAQKTGTKIGLMKAQKSGLMIVLIGILLLGMACDSSYTPKPTGYMRIDYPEKDYRLYDEQEFFRFEIPTYAEVEIDRGRNSEAGWVNLQIPSLNGTIHLSYKPVVSQSSELGVTNNLTAYITDSRDLVYKHTVKAQGIEDTPFIHREEKRFGMIYDLKGDVASAVQFFVTDSTTHFLRGSLYLNCRPNRDSLNPVIEFLREDIIHLIETTSWKY